VANAYVGDLSHKTQQDIYSVMDSLRSLMSNYQKSLFAITNALVRVSPDSRQAVLDYYSTVIKKNAKRTQTQGDPKLVSSDGFILNLLAVMMMFAEPFMDINYTKMDRISTDYYRNVNALVNVREDTKINAMQDEYDAFAQTTSSEPLNFISHCFYLGSAINHIGFNACVRSYKTLENKLQELERQLELLQKQMDNPALMHTRGMAERLLQHLKTELDAVRQQTIIHDAVLEEPMFFGLLLRFTLLTMTWLVRLVDPKHQHPQQPIQLPLPKDIPQQYSMLPEYFIEDAIDLVLFAFRRDLDAFNEMSMSELMTFCIVFLQSSHYIKNPYLKNKLVEILFYATVPSRHAQRNRVKGLLEMHPLSKQYLMSCLMNYYCDVEQTGLRSQFYDKFNVRYYMSQIFKFCWNSRIHQQRIRELVHNHNMFVRFINLLRNDTTYLLDESIGKLREIHTIEVEMADANAWMAQEETYRNERQQQLAQDERTAKSYMSLANETVRMLRMFTQLVPQPFLAGEIIDQLAAMLNYNLATLAGPKCSDLKASTS
jgi:ubiquitin conjugation factor E4 B